MNSHAIHGRDVLNTAWAGGGVFTYIAGCERLRLDRLRGEPDPLAQGVLVLVHAKYLALVLGARSVLQGLLALGLVLTHLLLHRRLVLARAGHVALDVWTQHKGRQVREGVRQRMYSCQL